MQNADGLRVIDFHSHHVPARFEPTTTLYSPAPQHERWKIVNRMLADEALLMADIRSGDLDARVVNVPAALIADAQGHVPHETIRAINDEIAQLVSRHAPRLVGLATIDAYDGDRAAREAERAITQLGLRGLFVDCARGDMLIDAPQARPTLEVAARLGAPVFVHPVNPEPMTRQMTPYGRIGTLFARGAVNAAAMIALMEGGVFAQLPGLRVVVTALAFGGLSVAGGFSGQSLLPGGAMETLRRHVFIDTMGFNPALVRASVDLLGASNVIAGSDWPILNEAPIRDRLLRTLAEAGLDDEQTRLVASGSALALLGIDG